MSVSAMRTKCLGFLGWIFGHSWMDIDGYMHNYCKRCGMPKGGWSNVSS